MRHRDERGAATVLTVALAGLLLVVGAALGVVAALVVAHRTAQAAADLAALAAAQSRAGDDDACAAAARVAEAHGAALTSCLVGVDDVRVAVVVTGPRWLGQSGDLSAQARAGPAR